MSNQTQTVDVNTLSIEQLQAALEAKQKAKQDELNKKRKQYEEHREQLITFLGGRAQTCHNLMAKLKKAAFQDLQDFKQLMLEYGDLRRGAKNKGSFQIKNEKYKIEFASQINKRFDERAQMAEVKLKDFLASYVKKKDLKSYKLVTSLLERNPKTGDYDVDLINRLYAMENDFDDENWRDAIRLFKESYCPSGTAQYVRFWVMAENGNWLPLVMDFAKINLPELTPLNPAK